MSKARRLKRFCLLAMASGRNKRARLARRKARLGR